MSAKHTPGPWYGGAPDVTAEGGWFIADCDVPCSNPLPHEAIIANSRLIAAAPDLLEALEMLTSNPHIDLGDLVYQVRDREGLGWYGPAVTAWGKAVQAAAAAIAKAKGETK